MSFSKLPDELIETILSQYILESDEVSQFLYFSSTYDIAKKVLSKKRVITISLRDVKMQPKIRRRLETLRNNEESQTTGVKKRFGFMEVIDMVGKYSSILSSKFFEFDISLALDVSTIVERMIRLKDIIETLQDKVITLKFTNYTEDHILVVLKTQKLDIEKVLDLFDTSKNTFTLEITENSSKLIQFEAIPGEVIIDTACFKSFSLISNNLDTPISRSLHTVFKISQNVETMYLKNFGAVVNNSQVSFTVCPNNKLRHLFLSSAKELDNTESKFLENFESLVSLDLTSASICDIRGFLECIGVKNDLTLLNLSQNLLQNVECIDFESFTPKLKTLIFDNQNANSELRTFEGNKLPKSLEKLSLANNKLKHFHLSLTPKLKSIDVSNNVLESLNFEIPHKKVLQSLNISLNKLFIEKSLRFGHYKSLGFIFSMIIDLRLDCCNISNEDLQSISELTLSRGSKLESLSLSHNRISNISCFKFGLFTSLPLKKLDLSFNKFRYLNSDNFPVTSTTHPNLRYINLKGNRDLKSINNIPIDKKKSVLNLDYTKIHHPIT